MPPTAQIMPRMPGLNPSPRLIYSTTNAPYIPPARPRNSTDTALAREQRLVDDRF